MAGILDFLNSMNNDPNNILGYVNSLNKDPNLTTPLARIASGGNPLIAKAQQSIVPNITNMANGILNMGKSAIQDVQQKGLGAIGDIPGAIANVVKGTAENLNNDLGQPVGTDTNGSLKLQMPNPKKALQHAVENPVSTAMDFAAVRGIMPKGGSVPPPVESGVSDAGTATRAIDTTSDVVKGKAPEASLPVKANKMITSADAPADAVANYNSIFQVPRNIVQNMRIKPESIINQLIDDGVVGKTLDELEGVSKNVTGDTGAFAKINRIMLSDVKDPISLSNISETLNLENPHNAITTNLEGSPKGLINTVTNQIKRAFPKYDNIPGENGITDILPNNANAADLFDTSQELGRLENMYQRKAYTVMGDLTNPEYERAAQAIGEVKNSINDSLDEALPKETYQSYKSDPRVIEQLQRVPPKMAQRWIDNATQFRDGRAIQAPYVGLSKMIEDTKDAQLAAFTKWTNEMRNARPSESIVKGITHPVQAGQDLAQKGLQKVISPIVDQTPEDLMRSKTSGTSIAEAPKVGVMSSIGNGIKTGANVVRQSIPAVMSAVGANNSPINTPSQSSPTSTPPPPTQSSPSAPSGSTRYSMGTPQASGFLTGNDYNTQQNTLTQQIAQANASGNVVVAKQLQGQLEALNNTWSNQGPVRDTFTKTNTVMGLGNAAYNLIQSAPVGLLNLSGSFDKLLTSTDPRYSALGKALQSIQNTTGIDLSSAKTKEALIAGLDYAISTQQNNFNSQLQQFFGGNSNSAAGTATNIPAVQNPGPIGSGGQIGQPVNYNFDFGSAGQGMPAGTP